NQRARWCGNPHQMSAQKQKLVASTNLREIATSAYGLLAMTYVFRQRSDKLQFVSAQHHHCKTALLLV
ncbi:MAG: hypothetical protein IJN67_12000, partial [Oscillospiraceae bacterium]|nr:hypothetical protein [Oscillospiraceae bacterium]